MPTVFVSYRRSDTEGEAGRLADTLQRELGRRVVFRDVVSISPGEHFDAAITAHLASSVVALVLIGPTWLEELAKRLGDGKTDYLRLEVATTLKEGKRVIPVLLKGATLPPADALPDDLRHLLQCQAITVRDEAWKADVDRLIDAIGRPYRWDLLGVRALVALVLITLAVWQLAPLVTPDRLSDYGFIRRQMLFLIGIYVIVEACRAYRHFRRLTHKGPESFS
jgi:hypothetical protein